MKQLLASAALVLQNFLLMPVFINRNDGYYRITEI